MSNPGLEKYRLLEEVREALKDPTFRFELAKILADHWTQTIHIEPLFDLKSVVRLVPLPSMAALRKFLVRHGKKFGKRYRLVGPSRRRHRLLYAHEIAQIRKHYLKGDV